MSASSPIRHLLLEPSSASASQQLLAIRGHHQVPSAAAALERVHAPGGDDSSLDEDESETFTPGYDEQRQHQQQRTHTNSSSDSGAQTTEEGTLLVPADLKLVQLRTELKKRGLSPSGLKHVLVKRLEDALQMSGEGGAGLPSSSTASSFLAKNRRVEGHQIINSNSDVGAVRRRRNNRGSHSPQLTSDDDYEDDLLDAHLPEEGFDEDSREQADRTTMKKRKNRSAVHPASPPSTLSPESQRSSKRSKKSRSKHARRYEDEHDDHRHLATSTSPSSSSPSVFALALAESTPLSGLVFVKEARYSQQQQQQQEQQLQEEIKSLERFSFEGATFQFSYQFWRGDTMLHSFDIEAGTFTVVDDDSSAPEVAALALGSTSGIGGASQQVRQKKVVLRWPSPLYYPLLQTWRFHQTYSHFHLHDPAAALEVHGEGAGGLLPMDVVHSSPATSLVTASSIAGGGGHLPDSTTKTPVGSSARLVSRLGSVFELRR